MKKRLTPEQRGEIVRILNEIRSDLGELRETFERLRARMDDEQTRERQGE